MAQAIYNNNITGAHFYSALFGSFTLYKAGSILSPASLPSAVKPAFGQVSLLPAGRPESV